MTTQLVWIDVVPPLRSGQHKRLVRLGDRWGMVQNRGYEAAMQGLVAVLYQHRPAGWIPLATPVVVGIYLYSPHTASTPKRDRGRVLPMAVTPDVDNLAKLYLDALTRAGWVVDDKLVTVGTVAKRRAARPGIGIVIMPDTCAGDPPEFLGAAAGRMDGGGDD